MSEHDVTFSTMLAKYALAALVTAGDARQVPQELAQQMLAEVVQADWVEPVSTVRPPDQLVIDEAHVSEWIAERYPADYVQHAPDVVHLISAAYRDFDNWKSDAGVPPPF